MQILNEANLNPNDHLEEHPKPAKHNFLDFETDCNQTVCSKTSMNFLADTNSQSTDQRQPLSKMLFNDTCLSNTSEPLKLPLKNIANSSAHVQKKYPILNLKPPVVSNKLKIIKNIKNVLKCSKSKNLPLSDGLSKLKESQNSNLVKAGLVTCTPKE